jgi:hypothetical protein
MVSFASFSFPLYLLVHSSLRSPYRRRLDAGPSIGANYQRESCDAKATLSSIFHLKCPYYLAKMESLDYAYIAHSAPRGAAQPDRRCTYIALF